MGRVIAEKDREFQRLVEVRDAEHRAVVAEFRNKILELETTIREYTNSQLARFEQAILSIKNGEPGPAGPPGEQGERGERGERGEQGVPGPAGVAGERGDRGDSGPAGERGEPGPQGERGLAGEQGREGVPGRDGLPGVPGPQGERGKDGINGQDGRHGVDGKDGAGFDTWTASYDNVRTFIFTCGSGDRLKEFSFEVPLPIDRGIWRQGIYMQGDFVSRNGSLFIAQKNNIDTMPGASTDWRLAVKHGRDGKDGKDGERGLPGPQGKPGMDATQLGPNGGKW